MTERPRGGKDELSATLLKLRKAAGLSGRLTAERTGFSQAKVSRLERGINVPTEADVTALTDVYAAPAAERRRLVALARDIKAEHRPVVMARSHGHPGVFQARLSRIEAASAQVRAFAPTAIPGMLQTEPYMRALIANRELPAGEVETFVRNRLARQTRLTEPGTPHFTLITTEAAFGWRLGSRDDMAALAEHVADATRIPDARIGIIPWGVQADRVVLHGWDIYDERAVSYGTTEATAVLTEPRDVGRYLELHAAVERIAVFDDDARAILRRIAAEYRGY